MKNNDIQKYKKMDEIEHVLSRPGMYVGSINTTEFEGFLYDHSSNKMILSAYAYNPGLIKLFDEIISNSVDEYRRSKSVSYIKVQVCKLTGEISVEDDGGIPVQIHPEYNQYIPEMIFGELRTGSNFSDEDRTTSGLNGLGGKLVSIFSSTFKVETSDGSKSFIQTFSNNLLQRTQPTIRKSDKRGTKITFTPDYEKLNCELDEDNYRRIEKRVYDIAGCNPKIKVYINNELIKVNKFKDYVNLFVDEFIEDSNDEWEIALSASDNGFKHVSFVNGVDTFNGGTHIDYISNQIISKLREYIKKKHKLDLKPANIKQHLFLFINCTVNAPTFTSQTKEFMSLDSKDYGTQYEVSDKFINQMIKSGIVQSILDWAEAQQRQRELAELRKMNKQTQNTNFLKKIVKFDDATLKERSECVLALTEGDSAAKVILSSRDPKTVGVFPLKGKPLNVRDIKVSKLTANEEFANIMAILGLKLREDHNIEDLRFGKVLIASDFDPDGNHICGLIVNMFQQFWPNLIKQGLLVRLRTPVIVATISKTKYKEFFSMSEYEQWRATNNQKHSMKWFKGLGSWSSSDFKRFLSDDKYQEPLIYDDISDFECVDLAFDKSKSDERKLWLTSTTNEDI